MSKKTKRQQLIEDMRERYERLGTYRAVESELEEQYGESGSCALIAQVVAGAWSPKLARITGLTRRRIRLVADCDEELRDAIGLQCEALEMTRGEFIEYMFSEWFYDAFAYDWREDWKEE